MEENLLKKYRTLAAISFVKRNISLDKLVIDNDYIEVYDFLNTMIDEGLLNIINGEYSVSDKGIFEEKKLIKELHLKGLYKYIYPDFSKFSGKKKSNHLYYF